MITNKPLTSFLNAMGFVVQTAPKECWWLFFLNLLSGAAPALFIWLSSRVIDRVQTSILSNQLLGVFEFFSEPTILIIFVLLIFLSLVTDSLHTVEGLLMDNLRDRIKNSAKGNLIKAVANYPNLSIHESSDFATKVVLAEEGIEKLPVLADSVSFLLIGIFGLVPVVILSGTLAWWIPFILLLFTAPMIIVQGQVETLSWDLERSFAPNIKKMRILERILKTEPYAKEIRLLSLQQRLFSEWSAQFNNMFHGLQTMRISNARKVSLVSYLSGLGTIIPFIYVVDATLRQSLSVGDMALFVGIIFQVRSSLSAVIFNSGHLHNALLESEVVFEVSGLDVEEQTQDINKHSFNFDGSIKFNNVSFSYPGSDRKALENVSLELKPNEHVALVGSNGAGKSTLVKLICRFYEPSEGNITWGGEDIRKANLEDLHKRITAVFQDFARFPLTARENIELRMTDGNLDQNLATDVAQKVGILDQILSLEHSWETPLTREEAHGVELSGGQWQRLALARALYGSNQSKVVLLDEPTAALDPNTEHDILNTFEQLMANKLSVVVTHRLALTRKADKIVVLDAGRIIEIGNHDELINNRGPYYRMYSKQASAYITAD